VTFETDSELARWFKTSGPPPNTRQRYNAAPTQDLPVVLRDPESGERRLEALRWGLVPFWAKDAKIAYSTINAMAETVATKPAFRDAFKSRRCLVPADGFYEWQKLDAKTSNPIAFSWRTARRWRLPGSGSAGVTQRTARRYAASPSLPLRRMRSARPSITGCRHPRPGRFSRLVGRGTSDTGTATSVVATLSGRADGSAHDRAAHRQREQRRCGADRTIERRNMILVDNPTPPRF
jgi:hypothetical protein